MRWRYQPRGRSLGARETTQSTERSERTFLRRVLGAAGALLLLGACDFVDKTMLPSATGTYSASGQTGAVAPDTALSTLTSGQPVSGSAGAAATPVGSRQALVVIRFDRADVDYQAILSSAVSQALERRPNAAFDVVAVTPAAGNAQTNANRARRYGEEVFRSLIDMGLPPDRLSIGATSSPQAQIDEVHVYVR